MDTREWLLTNGLGSFASGTVCDARTRTYHGWLIAAIDPPSERTLLLSHLEASLAVGGRVFELGTNLWRDGTIAPHGYELLQTFKIDPVPTWVWGQEGWRLTRQLVMPHDMGENQQDSQFCHRVLVQYRYEGEGAAVLRVRPLVGDRNFHHQQQVDSDLNFSQRVSQQHVLFQSHRPDFIGTLWQLRWTQGSYQRDGFWYMNYHYPEETARGLGDCEDLYSPGCLTVTLQSGETLTLEAKVGETDPQHPTALDFQQAVQAEQRRLADTFAPVADVSAAKPTLWQQLLKAGDQFVVHRSSINGPTVIAGYPWFNDWGRDTLIALPGLALATQRFDLARGLLQTFSRYCDQGLIPNAFSDAGSQPFYNSIDAVLWWIETLGLYLEAAQDWEFLTEQYPTVQKIYKAFTAGTLYNISIDASDGLVTWDAPGVALTWMDAVVDGQPVTPRCGKPVEINALWYSALCWAGQWAERLDSQNEGGNPAPLKNQTRRYIHHAQQVQASLQKFWNPEQGYFYDTIAPDDRPDPSIRPNAVIALSLRHCGFPEVQSQRVLQVAKERLLTPYGLRSLDPADRHYVGHYAGDPHHRDHAYHQGTVWSWLIGPFIRAWTRFAHAPLPFDGQPLLDHFQQQACLGSISEIFDGDAPHLPQGAIAQAWSVAELLRHFSDMAELK